MRDFRRARRMGICPVLAVLLVLPAIVFAGTRSAVAATANTLTVKGSEYTFKLSGSPKAGWTEITFDDVGTEFHMMAVIPLKKGVTKKQVEAAANSNDNAAFNKIAGKGQA